MKKVNSLKFLSEKFAQYLMKLLMVSAAALISFTGQAQIASSFSDKSKTSLPATQPEAAKLDMFDQAPVLTMHETAGDLPGHYRRTKIIEIPFKYPLIRVEESVTDTSEGRHVIRENTTVADHVVVGLKRGIDAAQFAERNGFSVRRKLILPDVYLIAVPATINGVPDAIEKLQGQSEVIFVNADSFGEVCSTIPNNSPMFHFQWALNNLGGSGYLADADIDAPEAWDYSTGSNSIKVAVVDSGIWAGHPDLSANIATGGWDFVNDDADPMDDNHHGTQVAGIIGAVGNNGEGGEGVCWSVKLLPIKVSNANGKQVGSSVAEGIWYAVEQHADVINCSFSSPFSGDGQLACQEAAKNNIIVTCSAGNDGSDKDIDPQYPACYNASSIIAVAATSKYDHLIKSNNAWSSNFGLNTIHLGAPGEACYTTTIPNANGDIYTVFDGTSASAPFVAGVCALVKSVNPSLDAYHIKAAVLQSVDKLPTLAGNVATEGRLNAYKAVQIAAGEVPFAFQALPNSYRVPFNKTLVVRSGPPSDQSTWYNTGPTLVDNDILPSAATQTTLSQSPNQGGTVTFKPKPGEFTYSHPNFIGVETFEYHVAADLFSGNAKVTVAMLPPVAGDDSYKSSDSEIVVAGANGVFANDGFVVDPNITTPEISQGPEYGNITKEMKNGVWTGGFTYEWDTESYPNPFNSYDTFKYRFVMVGSNETTEEATVYLTTRYLPKFKLIWEEWIPPIKKKIPVYMIDSSPDMPVQIDAWSAEAGNVEVSLISKPLLGEVRFSSEGQLEYVSKDPIKSADKFQIALTKSGISHTIEVMIQPAGEVVKTN